MTVRERRLHVRLKPTADAPARAVLASSGLMREVLDVVDISIGGVALGSPALRGMQPGQPFAVALVLGTHGEHVLQVVVSWASAETVGAAFVESSPEASQAIGRYVAELLERGTSA